MSISSEETQLSEENYLKVYNEMIANVPECVKNYYDLNWGNITDQWVQYLMLQNLCMASKTNNRLESINSKLKSVITRYSSLENFIKKLFIIITSFRTNKDVKNLQMLNKTLVRPFGNGSVEFLYYQYLTEFAFEKIEKQLKQVASCNASEELNTETFWLLHLRVCFKWSKSYCEVLLNDCEAILSATSESEFAIADSNVENVYNAKILEVMDSKRRYFSYHEKITIMLEDGKKISDSQ
ncbi:hypothetical protein ABEB36_015094 [Hypothenemus hampei]|uniref:Uncharacterized protein n=1 Tax=Hypothenemus hampei TaxID=57062 RepID=A0ABD1E0D2_HYPHA